MPSPVQIAELASMILEDLAAAEGDLQGVKRLLPTCKVWRMQGERVMWRKLHGVGRVGLLLPEKFVDHNMLRVRRYSSSNEMLADVARRRRARSGGASHRRRVVWASIR